jgi:hypothetical protein
MLAGTQLRYWLRDHWHTIDLSPERYRIAVNGFSLSETRASGVSTKGDALEYFCGQRKTLSMRVTRSVAAPLEIRIEAWPPGEGGGPAQGLVLASIDGEVVRPLIDD